MTTGTATATGDTVILTGDAVRGEAAYAVPAAYTLTIQSADSTQRSLTLETSQTGRFLSLGSNTQLFLTNVSFSGGKVEGTNNSGGVILGESGTVTLQGTTFINNVTNSDNGSHGGAIRSAVTIVGGQNTFKGNEAGQGGAVRGSLTISGGVNTFDANRARGNDGGVVHGGFTIKGGTNSFTKNIAQGAGGVANGLNISGGVNFFQGNSSQYGGVAHCGATISGGVNTFLSNTSKYGGVLNSIATTNITGGTTLFENNQATSSGAGGAINLWFNNTKVNFSGNTTNVVFRGNYNSADNVMSDIALKYSNANTGNAVTFTGNGSYYFGGGIKVPTLTMNGGNITFGEGSVTDLNLPAAVSPDTPVWTLKNTNLTIRYGNVTSPVASTTKFAVGSTDGAIVDGGGNTIKLVVDASYTGSNTLISGNATGLSTVPVVQLSAGQSGYAYVSSADANGVVITRNTTSAGNLIHFASGSGSQTEKGTRNTLYTAETVAHNDVFTLTGNITRGASELTLAAGTKLTIQSASETARTISLGTGETGRFLNAAGANVVLDGVNVTGGTATGSNGGAIVAGTVTLSGNTSLTNNAAPDGGAIAGNVVINGTDSRVTFSGNKATNLVTYGKGGAVLGTLTVNQGTNVFTNNSATAATGNGQAGGGVASSLIINNGTNLFSGNTARLGGVSMGATLAGGTNTFQQNSAQYGGAIYGTMNISGGTNIFENNSSNSSGGVQEGSLTISGGTTYFRNNTAGGSGGAIFVYTATFSGDNTVVIFEGNKAAGGARNDIQAHASSGTRSLTIRDNGTYSFGGGVKLLNFTVEGGNITFGDGSVSAISESLTQTGGSLTLQGSATFQANATISGGSLNFEANPLVDGWGTLITTSAPTTSGTGKMNVGMTGFTTMKNATAYKLVQGANVAASAFTYNDALFDIAASGTDTVLTINTTGTLGDEYGQFQVNHVIDKNLADGDSIDVTDYNLKVATDDLDAFVEWLAAETGMRTLLGSGWVNVDLGDTVSVLGSDRFVWDFSGYSGTVTLDGALVNHMSAFVPEPSAFLLLLLGLAMFRRKPFKSWLR